jgi:sugar phosphate permease
MCEKGPAQAVRYGWLMFWLLACGYILVYFHRLCPAVVAVDMMRDLQAGGALLGLLSSAYFYPYAAMQIPAGLLSDSWGPRNTIALFSCVAFVGSVTLGFAPSLGWAITGRTLVGLGVSMHFVCTLKVLADWFRPQQFATMTGILIAMGGVGSITAATPLALLSSALGWRHSFVLVGLLTLAFAVLVLFIVRDRPQDKGWPSPAGHAERAMPPIRLKEGVKKVVSYPAFWPLAVWFFFNCSIFFSFTGLWGGPYLMHLYGLSKAQAGSVLMMSAFGMIVGSQLLSYLSTRVVRARKPPLVCATLASVGITFALAFYTDRMSVPALYVLCLGMGMCTNAIVVIGFTAGKELFPVQIAGTSTGLLNLFPFLGGALFQPLLGHLLERGGRIGDAFTVAGYRHAFLALFFCAVIAFVASLFLKETLDSRDRGGQGI